MLQTAGAFVAQSPRRTTALAQTVMKGKQPVASRVMAAIGPAAAERVARPDGGAGIARVVAMPLGRTRAFISWALFSWPRYRSLVAPPGSPFIEHAAASWPTSRSPQPDGQASLTAAAAYVQPVSSSP